ncbi:MAG: hypothetical protein RR893_08940 [Clostridia bacterium]
MLTVGKQRLFGRFSGDFSLSQRILPLFLAGNRPFAEISGKMNFRHFTLFFVKGSIAGVSTYYMAFFKLFLQKRPFLRIHSLKG